MATGKSSPEYSTQEVPLQLTPAATDKGQAQYLFDDKTVDFFVRALEPLQIRYEREQCLLNHLLIHSWLKWILSISLSLTVSRS